MDPLINDVNPFVTDNVGFFRWDVAPGWYQVRANHAGASVTTAAMPVPPEQLGLVLAVPAGEKPVATTAPKVNGDVKVGSKITASPGVWPVVAGELAPIEVHSYQWLRDGQPISGATQSQYTPVAADQGKTLTVALVLGRTLAADAGTVETWTVTLDAGKVPGSQLANTGADATLAQVGIAGAALLLLGGVLVVIAKRRREAAVSAD
jgi:LPXTG-motif cell wall-anchored protein